MKGSGWALLVIGEAGMTSRPLPAQGEVTIGRAETCDIQVDDPRLSRQHLVLKMGARLEVVDLGSRNGSNLRGQRLAPNKPVPLAEGDSIGIGSTVLVLQKHTGARPRRILAHGYFEARLEEECVRGGQGGPPFAVARVTIHDKSRLERGEELVAELTSPTDVIGLYLHGEYEILLLGATPPSAEEFVKAMRARFVKEGLGVEVTVATFPADGCTKEALLARSGPHFRETVDARPVMGMRFEALLQRVAPSAITVLILGETGVGKEVLARTIHERSPRAGSEFIAVNCAAITESLLESELFGYEKGAFTGAAQAKPGLVESASGGTVLLDEVGEMPPSLQAKLLRVLEQREVMRVGSLKPRPIDVRFISATNRNLEELVEAGSFRPDLFFRLNGISIVIPPLRERPEEIQPLAQMFVEDTLRQAGRRDRLAIDPEALEFLRRYAWPGNVRELRNVIDRAVLLCSGGTITFKHLPVESMLPPSTAPPPADEEEAPPPEDVDLRARVIAALEQSAWNQTRAAQVLGVSRRTLVSWLKKLNVPRPRS